MASQSHALSVGLAGPAALCSAGRAAGPRTQCSRNLSNTVWEVPPLQTASPPKLEPCPGPVPRHAQVFPYPGHDLVHLCASQCKQRCMLAAIQSAHTPPRSTTDKGNMSQSWDCPHGQLEPGVQTLTALWDTSHKSVVAFVGQEKVIHNLFVWGLLEIGLASHLLSGQSRP